MATEYFVMSNFGVRYFFEAYTDSSTVPATGTKEIMDVLTNNLGQITKDTKKYKTLGGNGWDTVAALGQAQEDATFECVRGGTGDIYDGDAGTSTYTMIKDWFMKATAQGGIASAKCIVEVLPRGNGTFEGTCYYVVPSKWAPGKRDTETGQEYNFDITPFGPQVPVTVTYTPAVGETPESWAFAKA
jgi:hypothetical protein